MMLRPKTWLAAARAAAGYSAPLVPFASFPAALTVEGQIRRPAELPHVELIALGGVWRPRGGRQVLGMRMTNPVTVQSLSEITAETLGPFPGGLVRAGMKLSLLFRFQHIAIGNPTRVYRLRIGAPGSEQDFAAQNVNTGTTQATGLVVQPFDVLSDVSAAHRGGFNGAMGFGWGFSKNFSPTVDFSQPWDILIRLMSGAETATNITSVSWSGGVAVFINPSHTLNTGDKTTVAGVSNTAYNGVYTGITRIDDNTWSGTLVTDPGGASTGGTSARISNMESQSWILTLEG